MSCESSEAGSNRVSSRSSRWNSASAAVELGVGAVGLDDQLDVRAHRLEVPPRHDELVAVAAGWLTI